MTNQLTRAEIYDHLARLEREGHPAPHKELERFVKGRGWINMASRRVLLIDLDDGVPMRLKPQFPPMVERTIRYPEPVREAPNEGQDVWVADPTADRYQFGPFVWDGEEQDQIWLHHGLIHLTERNARAHGMTLAGCPQDEIDAVLRGEDE